GEMIEQMNEVERRAEQHERTIRAHGFANDEKSRVQVQHPRAARIRSPCEQRIARAEFTARGFKHVDERGIWRGTRGRSQRKKRQLVERPEKLFVDEIV